MVAASRREPSLIALQLLNCIAERGEATRWDLIKILGNTSQFSHWVEEFLMEEGLVSEREEAGHHYYRMTEAGELFHRLLKRGNMVRSLLRLSWKRLRRL